MCKNTEDKMNLKSTNEDLYSTDELENVVEEIMNGNSVDVYHLDNVEMIKEEIETLFNMTVDVVDNGECLTVTLSK